MALPTLVFLWGWVMVMPWSLGKRQGTPIESG